MPKKKKVSKMAQRKKSSIGSIRQSLKLGTKRLKIMVFGLLAVIVLLLALSKIPATSNWPVVSYIKTLSSNAATMDEFAIFYDINQYRSTLGLRRLILNEGTLHTCAKGWARYLANNNAGIIRLEALPQNINFLNQIESCTGGKAQHAGENLGTDFGNKQVVSLVGRDPYNPIFSQWLAIPEFKANLDNPNFRQVAIGIMYDGAGIPWVVADFMSDYVYSGCSYTEDTGPLATLGVSKIGTSIKCVR